MTTILALYAAACLTVAVLAIIAYRRVSRDLLAAELHVATAEDETYRLDRAAVLALTAYTDTPEADLAAARVGLRLVTL